MTYETYVPAPVVIMEPASTTLPQMKTGQVFNGEFTMTNYGLIRADSLKLFMPADTANYKFELLVDVPDQLEAKQKLTIPYRITCLKSPWEEQASGGGYCGGSYTAWVTYIFDCSNGDKSGGGASKSWTEYYSYSCGGVPGWGGGGSGSGSGTGTGSGGSGTGSGSGSGSGGPGYKGIEGGPCLPTPPRPPAPPAPPPRPPAPPGGPPADPPEPPVPPNSCPAPNPAAPTK